MTPADIRSFLTNHFGTTLKIVDPDSYQVETPDYRLLIILSMQHSWLRMLVPIAPAEEAMTFVEEFIC
jgi:hypothetical protein